MAQTRNAWRATARNRARLEGLAETKQALAALPEAFRVLAADTIDVASRIILTEAGARAPAGYRALEAGHVRLKSSLGREIRNDGLFARVGSSDFTAKWVEFGTNDTPAQPFLHPAFRQGVRYTRSAMKKWVPEAGQMVKVGTRTSKGARLGLHRAKVRIARQG